MKNIKVKFYRCVTTFAYYYITIFCILIDYLHESIIKIVIKNIASDKLIGDNFYFYALANKLHN